MMHSQSAWAAAAIITGRAGVNKFHSEVKAWRMAGGLLCSQGPPVFQRRSSLSALILFVALMLPVLPLTVRGQATAERRLFQPHDGTICVLESTDSDAFAYVPRTASSRTAGKTSANIAITFLNETSSDPWPQAAKDAVNYAASIWAGLLSSQITIRIEATWKDLGGCTGGQFALASAGPQFIHRNFRNAPRQNTWYTDAVADALAGTDQVGGQADIVATFNRACGPSGSARWHLGTDGRPPEGTIDLASAALHEFAHGLGFFGSADVDDGNASNGSECGGVDGTGCIGTGQTNDPLSYDRYTEDGAGISLLALSNPSEVLGTALEGGRAGGVFFSGSSLSSAGIPRARLYSPATFNGGASYAHVDENTYNGTSEALMTPFLSRAEAIHAPGKLACGILEDVGWTVTGDCGQVTTTGQSVEEVPSALSVIGPYPNPLSVEANLSVSVTEDQSVTIDVFDALGRKVTNLYSGVLTADRIHVVRIDASGMPPGVYLVRISTSIGSSSQSLVIAR